MKIKFKHQKFQADAAQAVCDVFQGQAFLEPSYLLDKGKSSKREQGLFLASDMGFCNMPIQAHMTDDVILKNIQKIQRDSSLNRSESLEGRYNLTIEMETGVGKTYTYIKTMYELNKQYGWSKFIIVVPSVAIREGVYQSLEMTQEHFAEDYGKKIRFFIYKSSQLDKVESFASDSGINVMIINYHAFTGRSVNSKEGRRIRMKLDEFRSRRPIDVIAKANPIVILDEPQSLDGAKTTAALKDFHPLMTLRYSATHKDNRIFNMIYRLDALEAYNKKLVKKIAVKGIATSGTNATESYLYLSSINTYKDKPPTANLELDCKLASGVKKTKRILAEKDNLYNVSKQLEEYKDGYVISKINALTSTVEFINGVKIYVGDVQGEVNEEHLRRIQIRETILSHLETERRLYSRGIKVLSLFFIDEVAKYKQYDASGTAYHGEYANMFEEEYNACVEEFYPQFDESEYANYLKSKEAHTAHKGYFSIDKKKRMVDSAIDSNNKKAKISSDSDAYDLIMKGKERLLDRKEPVRFIFSHSALREGWDNPNVFQICTLKQSSADVRKRQEVGRGLRLCVDQHGERMDSNYLTDDVHNVNVLTVIASESYDSFAKALQSEFAEAIGNRPVMVDKDLFKGKVIINQDGSEFVISDATAQAIFEGLILNGYVKSGKITDKYYEDKNNGNISVDDEIKELVPHIIAILDTVFDMAKHVPANARENNVTLEINKNFDRKEFQALWKNINVKSAYAVDFSDAELVAKSIERINNINILPIYIEIVTGEMLNIKSKDSLVNGTAFSTLKKSHPKKILASANNNVKYDLIGKLTQETGLTRTCLVLILQKIDPIVFEQFKFNPEEFIIKVAKAINEEKATAIIQHITYHKVDESYDSNIFTNPTIKGKLGIDSIPTNKHIYDFVRYDSNGEREFAEELEKQKEVIVYAKLPRTFHISTPVGKYNPDWAIAFHKGTVKHIYFVAETKGNMETMQLRLIENAKTTCAKKHFAAISNDVVKYDVVSTYKELFEKVMK